MNSFEAIRMRHRLNHASDCVRFAANFFSKFRDVTEAGVELIGSRLAIQDFT